YTSEVLTLNQLADTAPRTEPWLLVIMTSTYTSNPPSNATAFRTWLERTAPGTGTWRNCRYLVWGLGNSQWNAFLAFPRYVQQKLADLGATPLADLGFGDVGSPARTPPPRCTGRSTAARRPPGPPGRTARPGRCRSRPAPPRSCASWART